MAYTKQYYDYLGNKVSWEQMEPGHFYYTPNDWGYMQTAAFDPFVGIYFIPLISVNESNRSWVQHYIDEVTTFKETDYAKIEKKIVSNYGGEMICACCGRKLTYYDDKYVVDHGHRYCIFCHDTCQAGKYAKCVMSVHKRGYMERKGQEHAANYSMNPDRDEHFYRPNVVPAMHPSYIPPFEQVLGDILYRDLSKNQIQDAINRLVNKLKNAK